MLCNVSVVNSVKACKVNDLDQFTLSDKLALTVDDGGMLANFLRVWAREMKVVQDTRQNTTHANVRCIMLLLVVLMLAEPHEPL